MAKSVTVYISSDVSTLGQDATQDDLDRYADNLAERLVAEFHCDVTVEQVLDPRRGGAGQCRCEDEALCEQIAEYVRDIEAGDGWVELLGE